jgi:hypothetical protein
MRSVRLTRRSQGRGSPQPEPTVGAQVPTLTDWVVSPKQTEVTLILNEIRRLNGR